MSSGPDTRPLFDEALRRVAVGDSIGAETLCREARARQPGDVNLAALHGAVLVKMGRLQQAETVLREAIAMAPSFAKPRADLGLVLHETGRSAEAVPLLEEATRLDPGVAGAWFKLGQALHATGRGREADIAFEKSFELSPERKALAHGARAQQEGNLQEAERLYREALRHKSGNVDAMRGLASILMQTRRGDEAERLLRKVLEQAPDFVAARTDLGQLLREQDRFAEAIECLQAALVTEPDNPRTHFLLGGTLAPAGLTYDAIEAYRRALALNPRHAGAWLGLAHTLKTVGKGEEAVAAYHESARLRPNNGEVFWSLANLKTYRFTDAEMVDMETKLASGTLTGLSGVNMRFALAKAHEDRGDFDRAWTHYIAGNAARRGEEWYDPVHNEVLNDAIRNVFSAELVERKTGGEQDAAPIFIVGLPRSGSTLLEQILASHSQVEGTAELPYIGRVAASLNLNRADGVNYPAAVRELDAAHLRALGQEYLRLAQMHRRRGAPRFIDKMPNNFPHVGFIHLILPHARIIDARRDPIDTCVSCYRQLFARGQPFTYDLVDIGEYYLQYRRMMDHWHTVLPGTVLTVQYEELVQDFETQVRRLLEFCGLPFEENCLRFHETDRPVRTASAQQVRRPLNAEAVGRWRHYEKHLGALKEVLAPVLDPAARETVAR